MWTFGYFKVLCEHFFSVYLLPYGEELLKNMIIKYDNM